LDPARMIPARDFQAVIRYWDDMIATLLPHSRSSSLGDTMSLKPPDAGSSASGPGGVPATVSACWPGGPHGAGPSGPLSVAWPPPDARGSAPTTPKPKPGKGGKLPAQPGGLALGPPGAIHISPNGLGDAPSAFQLPRPLVLPPTAPPPLAGPGTPYLDGSLTGASAAPPPTGQPNALALGGMPFPGLPSEGTEAEGDRAPIDPRKYKTRPCRNWAQTSRCSYEHTCCFAHGESELRDTVANMKILNSLGYFLNDADEMVRMPDDGGAVGEPHLSPGAVLRQQQQQQQQQQQPAAQPRTGKGRKGGNGGGGGGGGIRLTMEHLAALQ